MPETTNVSKGVDFERKVRKLANGLMNELRWKKYKGVFHESVATHTLKQCLQGWRMIAIEKSDGNRHDLNFDRINFWNLFHDLPEGDEDYEDIDYHEKRKSPKILQEKKKKEFEIHKRQMDAIIGVDYKEYLPKPLDFVDFGVRANPQDLIFMEAIEHINHSYFMLCEMEIGSIDRETVVLFHDDVRNTHLLWLGKKAYHFKSVREILDNELWPKWIELKRRYGL